MRKLFFLFLALVATTCLWAHDFEVDGIYYNNLEDNNVEVTYQGSYYGSYDNEYSGEVAIPSTVTYDGTTYSVTNIGDSAFYKCSSLTSVTIPNSVTSIGVDAFRDCSSLTSVTCEATTPPTLGTGVFDGTKLSAVYIPDNTLSAYQTAWGNEYAFVYNENTLTLHVATPGTLADLIFDAGTRPVLVAKLTLTGTLNDADFTCMRETMTSLVDVDLSGITNTSGVNFRNKTKLVRVILPTNLTSIGEGAFSSCRSLNSITIPESVTSIGERAFAGCFSLTSITIPNSVTSIGDGAFSSCISLNSIVIPNSVTNIGDSAFIFCDNLATITIPNSVTSIGEDAFFHNLSLNFVILTVSSIESFCLSPINKLLYDAGATGNRTIMLNNQEITDLIIPASVTSIGERAFFLCSGLTSVTIPNSVTSIGDWAFLRCSELTSVTIPNSVTSIGDYAFYYCSGLTSVTIGNSVTSIGERAFGDCSSLTSITCLGTTPPEANELAAPTTTCTLIVPQSAYNAYVRHAYWGQFLNIVPSSEMESSAPDIYINPANPAQKLLRNGQVYILKDDKTYTIMGAQIQ